MRNPWARRRLLSVAAVALATIPACSSPARTPLIATLEDAHPRADVADPETADVPLFDDTFVHDIRMSFDVHDYRALVATYTATGDKEWIPVTVTIDGHTYRQAGARLKGNTSLHELRTPEDASAASREPHALPWLIRLDRYEDGQDHDGIHDLVIRSNPTVTSLNEAVALDLLSLAGLPAQRAAAVAFRVGHSEPRLRLAVEHPDQVWIDRHFDAAGALYKATNGGNYTYRGHEPGAYSDAFDQESGDDVEDLQPLIEFLEFINHADDGAFAAELGRRLDVDGFARYLAMQELIENADDIDGGGNNSYLWYDSAAGRFTVVPWDHNLAFGLGGPTDGDNGGAAWFGDPREPPTLPDDATAVRWDGPGGSVLVDRFLAVREFDERVAQARRHLARSLYESGAAEQILEKWATLLTDHAGALVDAETVWTEAAAIATYFDPAGG